GRHPGSPRRRWQTRAWWRPGSPRSDSSDSLLENLLRSLHQFPDDPTDGLDLVHQPDRLAGQQVHRVDVARRVTVGRESHEAQEGYGDAPDDRLADDRLVGSRLLTSRLLTQPLLDEGRPQGAVRGVGPAVPEQGGAHRVLLRRLEQLLLVVRVRA